MKIPVISGLIEGARELGTKWFDLKRTVADGKIKVAAAEAEARATVLVTNASHVANWEVAQAEASKDSWKDEFWTILLALPIPFVFFGPTREAVYEGFEALQDVPEWYMWAILASISASFGIRSGLLEKLGMTGRVAASAAAVLAKKGK